MSRRELEVKEKKLQAKPLIDLTDCLFALSIFVISVDLKLKLRLLVRVSSVDGEWSLVRIRQATM